MKLGLFMMPLHDPNRDYTKILQDDREAILLAEKLGYEEAWVGEHYSAATEPITDPLQFMATLIPVTKSIKFGTSVLNLPQHHPAQVAGNCAMFDHLCEGRFVMGIGPGGLGSDFELFKVTDKDRSEMMVESIEIIHKIWASDPPYHIRGKYWDITIDSSYQPRLGIGPMRKPYQKPYPPVAVSAMSPSSPSARLAGERGWGLVSANFMPVGHAKTHSAILRRCRRGAAATRTRAMALSADHPRHRDRPGRQGLPGRRSLQLWLVLRLSPRQSRQLQTAQDIQAERVDPRRVSHRTEVLRVDGVAGQPNRVLDQLVALVDEVGYFGTLLLTHKDWDKPELHKRSMVLLAEKVMPKLRQHVEKRDQAAE